MVRARWLSSLVALCLLVLAALPGSAVAFEDTMAQRMLPCTLCHGKEGRAAPDGRGHC